MEARSGLRRRVREVLRLGAGLALAALLLPAVVGLDPGLRGWRADHGHVTLGGVVAPHAHPWDTAAATGAHEHGEDGAGADVALSDPGAGLAGAAAVSLPAAAGLLDSLHGVSRAEPIARARHPVSIASHVPTPPPRG